MFVSACLASVLIGFEARITTSLRATVNEVPGDMVRVCTVRTRPEAPAKSLTIESNSFATGDPIENEQALESVRAACREAGLGEAAEGQIYAALQDAEQQRLKLINGNKELAIDPNAGAQKGGWTTRQYNMQKVAINVTFEVVNAIDYPGAEDSKENVLYRGEWYGGTVVRPISATDLMQTFDADGSDLLKTLGGIKFAPENAQKAGVGFVGLPRLKPDSTYYSKGYSGLSTDRYMEDALRNINPVDLSKAYLATGYKPNDVLKYLDAMAGRGEDMNQLQVPGDANFDWPDCGSQLEFPPGTVWLPSNPAYQSMTTYQPISLEMRHAFASLDVPDPFTPHVGRSHCITMELKEPDASVKYFPYLPADETLVELMKKTAASRFRGPWDQARTWMYTSKAGLADINKRIYGGITAGQYVNNLFDIVSLAGYEQKDLKNKAIFDPAQFVCATANDAAFGWYASHMTSQFPKESASWLRSGPKELVQMLKAPIDEPEQKHGVRMMNTLLNSPNAEVRRAALELLDKQVGADAWIRGKLAGFQMSLISPDSKERETAQRVQQKLS